MQLPSMHHSGHRCQQPKHIAACVENCVLWVLSLLFRCLCRPQTAPNRRVAQAGKGHVGGLLRVLVQLLGLHSASGGARCWFGLTHSIPQKTETLTVRSILLLARYVDPACRFAQSVHGL
jgi:cell division protein FtsW (lipid II flippase)